MKAGWTTKRLGELCGIELGKTPARAVAAYWDPDRRTDNVWLSIADLQHAEGKVATDSKEYLSDLGAALCKPVQRGTLMVSFKLTLGRLAFAGRKLFTNEAIASLVILDERLISKEFLYWYLQAFDWHKAGEGEEKIKGVALNKALLRELLVHFPPLPEQQRIVALLDEAFAALATAAANAERNLDNARELFESHLAEVFSRRGDGWVERRLDLLCKDITVGFVGSMAREYVPAGVTFLRSQNIRPFEVSLEGVQFVPEEFHRKLAKSCLRPGDVAVVRTGYPGTAAVIPLSLSEANCADLVIVRPGADIEPQFLAAFFNSAFGKQHVAGKLVGAAQKHFNVGAAKSTVLSLPPRTEQRRIVTGLFQLRSSTTLLGRIYEQRQAALAALKRSLLHQAFNGEL